MNYDTQFLILAEVALAMLLGGVIGFERELADKPAGFRTHMLVAGSAALLIGLGDALLERFGLAADAGMRSDPIRIVEAIVTGISFLGAGTIFQRERNERVEGLTTAASILLSSAVGIAVGARQWVLAVGSTGFALVVLRVLPRLERWLMRRA